MRSILMVSLLINGIALFFALKRVYFRQYVQTFPEVIIEKPGTLSFLNRNQLFETYKMDSAATVFLGNSLTQNFELAELFPAHRLYNRGIAGDKIADILLRLEPIIAAKPAKIFIEMGTNDLGFGHGTDTIMARYTKLLKILQTECPHTAMYVQSILPTATSSAMLPNYCGPKVQASILELNQRLKTYCQQKNIIFINLYPSFASQDLLKPEYTIDGVHLTGQGYLLWRNLLLPYL
jgi:lysophospholipase L1-like esterase